MSKKSNLFFLVLILVLSFTASYAEVITLWSATDTTFVSSEHADNYTADTYYGIASVRGKDRVFNEDYTLVYYKWTKITYDVQGTIKSTKATSSSKFDSRQVVSRITVKDKWNNGPKTKVFYDYASASANGRSRMSRSSEVEILGGGVLEDGVVTRAGIVVEQGIPNKEILK